MNPTVTLLVLRILCLAFLVLGLGLITYGVASAPTRVASRLGLRGLKRQRVLAENEAWASVEPLVRWLGVRLSGLPSEDQRKELDRQIGLAGDYMGLTPDEYLALTVLSFVGGGTAGLIIGLLLLSLIHISEPTRPY